MINVNIYKIVAGFPSPAEDYIEEPLSLDDLLIQNKDATFFVRVAGDSMIEAGIWPHDILVIDRSLEAKSGNIVIAAIDEKLTIKEFREDNGKIQLLPRNPDYAPITVTNDSDFQVWGVATNCVHSLL